MGCIVAVRVTPRSSRPGIGEWRDGELEVRVSAPPADGEANSALIRLLAKQFGLPRSGIEIVSGAASHHKRVALPLTLEEVLALIRR